MITNFSELIKNKTLEFLSKSLPFLKEQRNLPKVARFGGSNSMGPIIHGSTAIGPGYRFRRSVFNSSSTLRVNNHGVRNCIPLLFALQSTSTGWPEDQEIKYSMPNNCSLQLTGQRSWKPRSEDEPFSGSPIFVVSGEYSPNAQCYREQSLPECTGNVSEIIRK